MTNTGQKDHRSLLKSQYHLEEMRVCAGPFITIKWCSGRQLVLSQPLALPHTSLALLGLLTLPTCHTQRNCYLEDKTSTATTDTITKARQCYLISTHLWSIVFYGQTQAVSFIRIFLFLKASVFLCCTKLENLHVSEWISLAGSYVLPPWIFLQPFTPDGLTIGLRKIPPELDQAWSRDDDLSSSILCTSHLRCLSKLLRVHGTLQSPSAQN